VDALEWNFLISGMTPERLDLPNPDPSWIEPPVWSEICGMAGVPSMAGIAADFAKHAREWRLVFESTTPHTDKYPGCGAAYDLADPATSLKRLALTR